jgi:DNA-binding transcriptional MerR regulator
MYEHYGLIPPAERTPKGYRRFTQRHLECLRLARLVYQGDYPGRALRRLGARMVRAAAAGDMDGAVEMAAKYRRLVSFERSIAESAAAELEHWAGGHTPTAGGHTPTAGEHSANEPDERPLLIGQAADRLGVTIDVLRNWERNNLIHIPRDPYNGYRHYRAPELARLRIIHMLSRAGYSIMAILRMMLQLDAGQTHDLRAALDTPRPDEDVFTSADRWLTTLEEQRLKAEEIILQAERIRLTT